MTSLYTSTPTDLLVSQIALQITRSVYPEHLGAVVGRTVSDTVAESNLRAINAAIRLAQAQRVPLRFSGGTYRIKGGSVDFKVLAGAGRNGGLQVRGGGKNGAPGLDNNATVILQATDNIPIVEFAGYLDVDGLAAVYENQQSRSDRGAVAYAFHNVSRCRFTNLTAWQAHTSFGIPQTGASGLNYNTIFNAYFQGLESWKASHTHFDLRNYNGGGTNAEFYNLYANGGGSLDFSVAGQSADYVVRGANWSGYKFGTISVDGLIINANGWHVTNGAFEHGPIRFEACTYRGDNDGLLWFNGSSAQIDMSSLELTNSRFLRADLPTGAYLLRLNAVRTTFSLRSIRMNDDCAITTPMMRPLVLSVGSSSDSDVRIGRIDAPAGLALTWSDSSAEDPPASVTEFNGMFVNPRWIQARSTMPSIVGYAVSAPTTGTWSRGSILYNTAPRPGGHVGWICISAGRPGTWKPFGTIAP